MTNTLVKMILLSASIGMATVTVAQADCESDLLQLEAAFKTPNQTPVQKAALDEAKTKAVAALKQDNDKTCNAAVVEGMAKAGLKMK